MRVPQRDGVDPCAVRHAKANSRYTAETPVERLDVNRRAVVVRRGEQGHPFTDPCVRPEMMYFCTKMKPMIAGTWASSTPAANEPQFSS